MDGFVVWQKLSYFAIFIDGTIYFKNSERIGCSGIEYKSFDFELQEPIKLFTGMQPKPSYSAVAVDGSIFI